MASDIRQATDEAQQLAAAIEHLTADLERFENTPAGNALRKALDGISARAQELATQEIPQALDRVQKQMENVQLRIPLAVTDADKERLRDSLLNLVRDYQQGLNAGLNLSQLSAPASSGTGAAGSPPPLVQVDTVARAQELQQVLQQVNASLKALGDSPAGAALRQQLASVTEQAQQTEQQLTQQLERLQARIDLVKQRLGQATNPEDRSRLQGGLADLVAEHANAAVSQAQLRNAYAPAVSADQDKAKREQEPEKKAPGLYERAQPALQQAASFTQAFPGVDALGSMLGKLGPAGEVAAASLGAVVAPAALLQQGLGQISGVVHQFVGAFSPATIAVLDQAIQDFQASIGNVLLPLAGSLTEVFGVLNAAITASVTALRPAFEVMGRIVGEIGRQFAAALIPVLQHVGPVLERLLSTMQPVIAAWGTELRAIVEMLLSLERAGRPLIEQALPVLRDSIMFTARTVTTAAAAIAEIVDRLQDSGSSLLTAAANPIVAAVQIAQQDQGDRDRGLAGFIEAVQRRLDRLDNAPTTLPTATTRAAGQGNFQSIAQVAERAQIAALRVGESETANNTRSTNRNTEAVERLTRALQPALSRARQTNDWLNQFGLGLNFEAS